MASETEKGIYDDPNFAIICSFLNNYGSILQFPDITFNALKSYIETSNRKVHRILEDIFIRLLRRWKGRCAVDAWERVLVNFCYTYSQIDAWELEKFGFQRCSTAAKMRMLKNLLEMQFDCNSKFKDKINEKPSSELRLQPIGRDKNGLTYWFFMDKDNNARVYTEEQDETEESESWQIVAKDKHGIMELINNLKELKDAPSRSVTPSITGSGSVTPALDSRSATPAIECTESKEVTEAKEEVNVENVKKEIKEEEIDQEEVKVKPDILDPPEVKPKHEVEVKDKIKQEVKEENEEQEISKIKTEKPDVESKSSTETHEKDLVKVADEESTRTVSENSEKGIETNAKLPERKGLQENEAETKMNAQEEERQVDESESVEDKTVLSADNVDNKEKDAGADEEKSETKTKGGKQAKEIVTKENELKEKGNDKESESKLETDTASETKIVENESEVKTTKNDSKSVANESSKSKENETKSETKAFDETAENEAKEHRGNEDINCETETAKVDETCQASDNIEEKEKSVSSLVDEAERPDGDDATQSVVSLSETVEKNKEDEETATLNKESSAELVQEKSTPNEGKTITRGRGRRGRRKPGNKHAVTQAEKEELKSTEDKMPKQRKRKRGRGGSDSEPEVHIPEKIGEPEKATVPLGRTSVKSESDLSETPPVSGNESKEEECTPSKRRRDKFLKKRKPVKKSDSDSTDESAEPEKKPKKVVDETETDMKTTKTKDSESTAEEDTGSQKENCPKKCGKRKEDIDEKKCEELEEAPTSKKGRPSSQGRGVGRRKKEPVEIPVENLRRSTRATRGVQRFEVSLASSPRRKRNEKEIQVETEKPRSGEVRPKHKAKKDLEAEKENRDIEEKSKRKKKKNVKQTIEVVKNGKKNRRGRPKLDETDEEDEDLLHEEEEESEPSLHWSSPSETEYENDSDGEVYIPKGRNAKRQQRLQSIGEIENNDTPCCKCGKYDHPEWILLCDTCDAGYHTGCLRPPLMIIPDDDWYCPPCEHSKLIVLLLERLNDITKISKGNDRLQRRRERLKFVGISLDNILTDEPRPRKRAVIESSSDENTTKNEEDDVEDPDLYDNGAWETLKDKERRDKENRQRDIQKKYYYDWGQRYVEKTNSYSEESESPEFSSSSEEDEYSMVANRSRRERKQINYNFNEFDEIITSAIKQETEYPTGRGGKSMKNIIAVNNRKYSDEEEDETEPEEEDESWKGQGKDMRNIEAAIAKEKAEEKSEEQETEETGKPKTKSEEMGKEDSEEEQDTNEHKAPKRDVFKDRPSHPLVSAKAKRKKSKRLTALSDDEDDDNDTDEYKVSEDEGSDDNYQEEEDEFSEESFEYKRRGSSRYKNVRDVAVRRSTRRRRVLRDMSDFVVDEYESDEECSHRNSRRSTRRKRYSDNFSEEEESVDSEFYSDDSFDAGRRKKSSKKTSKSKSKSASKKRKRKMKYSEETDNETEEVVPRQRKSSVRYEDDSDYNLSDESGYRGRGRRRAASKRINYQEILGSGSEGDSPKRKKKGKLDVNKFVKSDNEESNTDEYVRDDNNGSSDGGGSVTDESGPRTLKTKNNNSKTAKKRSRIQAVESSSEEEEGQEEQEELNDLENKGYQGNSAMSKNKKIVSAVEMEDNTGGSSERGNCGEAKDTPLSSPNTMTTTYVFKARVNGCDNNTKPTNQNEVNKKTTTTAKEVLGSVNGERSDENDSKTEVDSDDLEDIGDIVDYITQDGE